MARIVPARPIEAGPAVAAALRALESGLGDDHLVLQRGRADGVLLVAHPDLGACAVVCLDGRRAWDPDEETWQGLDLADAARGAARTFGLGTVQAVALLADVPRPPDAPAGVLFLDGASGLPAAVTAALASVPHALGEAGIDALIQADSPGAAAWSRGTVTEAQRRWRDTTPSPASNQAAAPTSTRAEPPDPSAASMASAWTAPVPEMRTEVKARVDEITIDDPLLLLLRQAVDTVAAGRSIFVRGMDLEVQDLCAPDFLLPAVLIAAAADWAPVVVSKDGKGGFHMRMRTDRDAILGYRLTALEPSAPLLLMLPVVDRLRRSVRAVNGREALVLDDSLASFGRWLLANRLDMSLMDEIDMRIALQ